MKQYVFSSTCLSQTLLSFFFKPNNITLEELKKVTAIISFLLNHSADPDAELFSLPGKLVPIPSFSIREYCSSVKDRGQQPLTEIDFNIKKIMELIISAPKLAPDEPPMKKMRI